MKAAAVKLSVVVRGVPADTETQAVRWVEALVRVLNANAYGVAIEITTVEADLDVPGGEVRRGD